MEVAEGRKRLLPYAKFTRHMATVSFLVSIVQLVVDYVLAVLVIYFLQELVNIRERGSDCNIVPGHLTDQEEILFFSEGSQLPDLLIQACDVFFT